MNGEVVILSACAGLAVGALLALAGVAVGVAIGRPHPDGPRRFNTPATPGPAAEEPEREDASAHRPRLPVRSKT